MSSAKIVNITELMTSYNFEIEELPDNLKCAKCKLVLKDACQVPCGCTFCRICVDDMMTSGVEFCPGVSEECGASPLSLFSLDYRANKSVSRLIVKCANNGCVHECQLANMEEHLRECQRKNVECPFRQLGCNQHKLGAEQIDGNFQHENRTHSEILIGMIANINRDIDMMKQREEDNRRVIDMMEHRDEDSRREIDMIKQRDEDSKREIDMIKQRDEDSKREIDMIKQRDEDSKREIDMMKRELLLKDELITSIIDRMIHVENENKSITREKANLADRVRLLTEKIEREIDERRANDEFNMASMIEHVDREIAVITVGIGSNKDEFSNEVKSIWDDIRSINQGAKSITDDISSMKSQLQSIQVDERFEWLIDIDIGKTRVGWPGRTSDYFTGKVSPYKYRLASWNDLYTGRDSLVIVLRIYPNESDDGQLAWPFEGRVIITVADKNRRELSRSVSLQCRINRASNNDYSISDQFEFPHSELRGAGFHLGQGVRVLCEIILGAGR